MLHRSFKPAKCKASLKLVTSRTKLLKNKKQAVVKQLRRELAQLLESGQDQTALIRVEHLIREEMTMTAYELIELFCELLTLRLPIIESQKNCPIDLKEAVTSVIFAAPRCSDIPELTDVRKQLTAKYGKEFASAAVELRADCGVNRQLVEKLSAKAPDGPIKLKILTSIAKEHNIAWEPKAFGHKDAKPHEDFLNGPNTCGNANNMRVDSSNVQSSYYDPRMSDTHTTENEVKPEAPVNYHGDVRSALSSQNAAPADVNASATPSHHQSSSGSGMDRMESGNLDSEVRSSNFVDRENWNMEFTDAAAAAQAAAESAERASVAARAAAQLSSRGKIMPGQSTGPLSSPGSASFYDEATLRGQSDNNFDQRSSTPRNEEISAKETSHLSSASPTSDSLKGNKSSSTPLAHGVDLGNPKQYGDWDQTTEKEEEDLAMLTERLGGGSHLSESRNSQNVPESKDVFRADEFTMRRQSDKFEEEPFYEIKYGSRIEKIEDLEDERFKDTIAGYSPSSSPSSSFFINRMHNEESNSQKLEDTDVNSFANFKEEKFHGGSKTTNDSGSVVFDNYGSDDENFVFDLDKGPATSSDIFSPDRKWTSYQPENVSAVIPERSRIDLLKESVSESHMLRDHKSDIIFSKDNQDGASHLLEDELPPAIFDDVGSPQSVNEEELGNFERDREDPVHSSPDKSRFSLISEDSAKFDDQTDGGNRDSPLHLRVSSVNESDDDSLVSQKSATLDDSETLVHFTHADATELRFGKLTSGIRNQGYWHPPYTLDEPNKRPSGIIEEKSTMSLSDEAPFPEKSVTYSVTKYGLSRHQEMTSGSRLELNYHGQESLAGKMSITRESMSSHDTEQGGKEEVVPRISSSRPRYGAGLSRRTKGSLLKTEQSSVFKPSPFSEEEELQELSIITSRNSYSDRMHDGQSACPTKASEARERKADIKSFSMDSLLRPSHVLEEEEEKTREPLNFSASRSSYSDGRSEVKSLDPTAEDAQETRADVNPSSKSLHSKLLLPSEEETQEPSIFSLGSSYKDKRSNVLSTYPSEQVKTRERRAETKSSSRGSYGNEIDKSARTQRMAKDTRSSSDQVRKVVERPESKLQKPTDRPSDSPQASGSPDAIGSSKPVKPSLGDSSKEYSFDRASHVHPKLPDYDTIAAQLETLRANRK